MSLSIAELLTLISAQEGGLNAMKSFIENHDGTTAPSTPKKSKKTKKEVVPDAPVKEKRAPTPWMLFTQRVKSITNLKPTDSIQFASFLKEKNSDYDSWTESSILDESKVWVKPEKSKKQLKAESSASNSDSEKPEAKPEEAKPEKKSKKQPKAESASDSEKA